VSRGIVDSGDEELVPGDVKLSSLFPILAQKARTPSVLLELRAVAEMFENMDCTLDDIQELEKKEDILDLTDDPDFKRGVQIIGSTPRLRELAEQIVAIGFAAKWAKDGDLFG
jgi:hypothetical protein